MGVDPVAGDELEEQRSVEPALAAIVDILGRRLMPELGEAEARGELMPGGTVVEGTAGNTGIGIALVANALGYKTIIVMPDNQSKEKMDTLRALGAELVLVPPTKFADCNHFVHTSRRLAEETDGAVWANQFDNTANRKAHIDGTAKELWEQLDGKLHGFTCAAGTGGTIAGSAGSAQGQWAGGQSGSRKVERRGGQLSRAPFVGRCFS